jgi:putative ABC transport system permease protein
MLARHHQQKDYEVVVPLELLARAEETKRIFNIVLGCIASISLLVGGIGIMNVMLATVTERTREIGIRRALGARRHHIMLQFLVETVVLSVGGGVLGIALGVFVPVLVEYYADMRTIVTLSAPLLAFGISVSIGLVFGLYPAWQAANLNPVDALRHG